MRYILRMALVGMLVVGVAGLSNAEDKIETAGHKLADGAKDSAIGWTELPKEMYETGKQNPLLGLTAGAINGTEKVVLRTTEGATDVGAFYLPDSERQLRQVEPNRSAGQRLADGVKDSAIGWTELPVEMYETGKQNPLLGLTAGVVEGSKKVVFRTTEGAIDVGAFYLPDSKKAE